MVNIKGINIGIICEVVHLHVGRIFIVVVVNNKVSMVNTDTAARAYIYIYICA